MEAPKEGKCFDCGTACTDFSWCYGCHEFVCEECGINSNLPWGGHDAEDHLEDPDEAEEDEE